VKVWQHDETGRITESPESPGPRWAEVPEFTPWEDGLDTAYAEGRKDERKITMPLFTRETLLTAREQADIVKKIDALRRAVRSAWFTSCENYREFYDKKLFELLGIKHLHELGFEAPIVPKLDGCINCANAQDFGTLEPGGPCQGCRVAGRLVNWTPR
jgi:hypothetical protein